MDPDPPSSSTWTSLRTWSKWTTILILLLGILIIFELMRLRHRTNALSSSLAWDAMDHMIRELPKTVDDAVERALDRVPKRDKDSCVDRVDKGVATEEGTENGGDQHENDQKLHKSVAGGEEEDIDGDTTIEEFSTPGVLQNNDEVVKRTRLRIVEVSRIKP